MNGILCRLKGKRSGGQSSVVCKRCNELVWLCVAAVVVNTLQGAEPSLKAEMRNGEMVLHCSGLPLTGVITVFESSDLGPSGQWVPIDSAPASEGSAHSIRAADLANSSTRFYRFEVKPIAIPPNMIWLRPGSFLMGGVSSDPRLAQIEIPQHEVAIVHGLWMSRLETRQFEYSDVMGTNPSDYQGDPRCPVESITWEQAMDYCSKVTERESAAGRLPPGYVYRLPTEAEWEYACRAGTTTVYSFGDDPADLTRNSWWGHGDSEGHPQPVAFKLPNPWGFYDMHGNVFEYCLDWYGGYAGGAKYTGQPMRVARGGSFYCPDWVLRSSDRSHSRKPDDPSKLHGFRVVIGPRGPLDDALKVR